MASLITGYHFILYFSFNCSGYGLTVIKKSHTWNCYSCLQKFLLKHKFTNSLLPIYIFSLMPYSINTVKSFMLFTSKKFVFWFYTEKKFCSRKWWRVVGGGLAPPALPKCLRSWLKPFHLISISLKYLFGLFGKMSISFKNAVWKNIRWQPFF